MRYRLALANGLLLIALAGGYLGRRIESAPWTGGDFLAQMEPSFRDWKSVPIVIPDSERALLQPDALFSRTYRSRQGRWIDLTVVAGHRKSAIHSPSFCLGGDGWETISEESVSLPLPNRPAQASRARVTKEGAHILVSYFFTDGRFSTPSLSRFQVTQMLQRFQPRPPLGALVRILTPAGDRPEETAALVDDFAATTLPPLLERLERERLK